MIQQINLYKVEKIEVDKRISFKQFLIGFWVFLGILFLMTVHNIYGFVKDKIDIEKLEKIQSIQTKDLDGMMSQVEQQKANEKILEELKLYEDKNKSKNALLESLSASDNAKIIGYSNYFESLAKKTIQGLWVNKVVIKDSGNYLFLSGECLSPELVTQFIASLSSESAFSGKTFALFNMALDEKSKKITFNVETKKALS
ncbi:MAG: hypothetical protein KBD23_02825 [Gammaproteobacteria bacterium]|nr:hypothetical protein [Gammaproteobacteria bacterium]MBP9729059.1 hypothetical protein [Gammaproteobacteria bacterium]